MTCGWRSKAGVRWRFTAAPAATCRPRKGCWPRSNRNSPCLRQRRASSMVSEQATGFTVVHDRPQSFYGTFERKAELQHQTHYCPGCGHGIIHKLLAEAIDELGIQDRSILITPVGCSVFGYYYFDVGNIQVAHGRAPAVATAVKRSRPESVVVAYQG